MSYYGYARVSAKDQNLDRQIEALIEFGIPEDRIYQDRQSGRDFERPEYRKLVKRCRIGDVIVVKELDRLGRNYDEMIQEWRLLTKQNGIDIVVIDMPLLDTRKKENDLTSVFIADLVLQLLSYVAHMEREKIRSRQAEGIKIARENGVKFGRPQKPVPKAYHEAKQMYLEGRLSSWKACEKCGISHTTFLRWIKQGI